MDFAQWLVIVAMIFVVVAYVYYGHGEFKGSVAPNRWSWLIWAVATAVEAFTYQVVNEGTLQAVIFVVSAVMCFMIFGGSLVQTRGVWVRPTRLELVCVVASGIALVLWLHFDETVWAHFVMIAALPIAFIPTWKNARKNPEHENSPAWGLWTIGDMLTLAVVLTQLDSPWTELPYIIVEFACHLWIWWTIGFRSVRWSRLTQPFRTQGAQQ